MTKVHICIHISTRNKFHFETLSITLKTTSDKKKKKNQLLKFILRKQLNNFAKMYSSMVIKG